MALSQKRDFSKSASVHFLRNQYIFKISAVQMYWNLIFKSHWVARSGTILGKFAARSDNRVGLYTLTRTILACTERRVDIYVVLCLNTGVTRVEVEVTRELEQDLLLTGNSKQWHAIEAYDWLEFCYGRFFSITAKNFFFRYYLSSAGCLYVSIYVSM